MDWAPASDRRDVPGETSAPAAPARLSLGAGPSPGRLGVPRLDLSALGALGARPGFVESAAPLAPRGHESRSATTGADTPLTSGSGPLSVSRVALFEGSAAAAAAVGPGGDRKSPSLDAGSAAWAQPHAPPGPPLDGGGRQLRMASVATRAEAGPAGLEPSTPRGDHLEASGISSHEASWRQNGSPETSPSGPVPDASPAARRSGAGLALRSGPSPLAPSTLDLRAALQLSPADSAGRAIPDDDSSLTLNRPPPPVLTGGEISVGDEEWHTMAAASSATASHRPRRDVSASDLMLPVPSAALGRGEVDTVLLSRSSSSMRVLGLPKGVDYASDVSAASAASLAQSPGRQQSRAPVRQSLEMFRPSLESIKALHTVAHSLHLRAAVMAAAEAEEKASRPVALPRNPMPSSSALHLQGGDERPLPAGGSLEAFRPSAESLQRFRTFRQSFRQSFRLQQTAASGRMSLEQQQLQRPSIDRPHRPLDLSLTEEPAMAPGSSSGSLQPPQPGPRSSLEMALGASQTFSIAEGDESLTQSPTYAAMMLRTASMMPASTLHAAPLWPNGSSVLEEGGDGTADSGLSTPELRPLRMRGRRGSDTVLHAPHLEMPRPRSEHAGVSHWLDSTVYAGGFPTSRSRSHRPSIGLMLPMPRLDTIYQQRLTISPYMGKVPVAKRPSLVLNGSDNGRDTSHSRSGEAADETGPGGEEPGMSDEDAGTAHRASDTASSGGVVYKLQPEVAKFGPSRLRRGSVKTYAELCENLSPVGAFGMGLSNPIRRSFIYLANNVYFANSVLLVIILNCVTLAMGSQEPGWEDTGMGRVLGTLDYVFNAVFMLEMVVKILAMGFIASPGTYLRDGWNVLDFVVVSLSVLGWLPGVQTGSGITAIRTVRALRPLRTITRVPGLRNLVEALINSLPMLFDVVILLGFLFLLYGIIGLELLSGKMSYSCWQVTNWNATTPGAAYPAVPEWGNPQAYAWPGPFATTCSGPLVEDYPQRGNPGAGLVCAEGWFCGQYVNNNYGLACFDNIGVAFLVVLYCLTTSGWTDVMYQAMDAISPAIWVYFCAIVITTAWFAANLAVAVLYVQFAVKDDKKLNLTVAEESRLKRVTSESEALECDRLIPANNLFGKFRWLVRKYVAERSWFSNLTVVCIVVNTSLLGVAYYGIPTSVTNALEVTNTSLTVYFVAEMLVKLLATGPYIYARDRMNLFDAVVVVFGLLELVLGSIGIATTNLSVLRSFRLLRVFKLARKWRELNRVLTTILASLSAVSYLSMLLFLFVFIMAVLGMNVFGYQIIMCDQYNLGASVQPVCPVGLSTEAGSCPDGHYYDCYAPCAASVVDQWVMGTAGAAGWPGTPTGLCKAYLPPGTTARTVGVAVAQTAANGSFRWSTQAVTQYPDNTEMWIWVGPSYLPRANFDSFLQAFVTIFQILTTENWNNAMWDGMRSTHWAASLFYVFTILIGYYIFLNLFLAILLDNFNTSRVNLKRLDSVETTRVKRSERRGSVQAGSMTLFGAMQAGSLNTGGTSSMKSMDRQASTSGPRGTGSDSLRSIGGADTPQFRELDSDHGSNMGQTFAQHMAKRLNSSKFANSGSSTGSKRFAVFGKVPILTGRSLLLFGATPSNPLRRTLAQLTSGPLFESMMICVIVISSLLLAIDSPRLDPASVTKTAIDTLNQVFICVFAVEMLLKMMAFDVFLAPTAYLRNSWNVLDGVIAVLGIAEWLLETYPPHSIQADPRQLKLLRSFRVARALRPLRLAHFVEGLKVVLSALMGAVGGILNVGLVVLLFYIIFGIVGMNLFQGMFYNCVWAANAVQPYGDVGLLGLEIGDSRVHAPVILDPAGGVAPDKAWCLRGVQTITWPPGIPPYNLTTTWTQTWMRNFDTLGDSVVALFEMSTTSLWLDVMWYGVDVVDVGKNPVLNNVPSRVVFFVLVMIVCDFFMLNLFVGVTIDKFVQLKEKADGRSILLTFAQRQWVEVQSLMLMASKPRHAVGKPRNRLRREIYYLVSSSHFEAGIMTVIVCTVLVMCTRTATQTAGWDAFQFWANITFSCVFGAEALLKLVAFGPYEYFKEPWNLFDFIVVLICFMGIAIDATSQGRSTSSLSLVRVLRVARIFRLIPKAKRLLKLFQTLIISLPALGNVGSVMFLFFYIFSVIAMNIFGDLRRNYYLKRHANFEDFPNAILVLFRMTGGENWNGIMHECMNKLSCVLVVDPSLPIAGQWYNREDPLLKTLQSYQWDDHCSPSAEGTLVFFIAIEIILTYVMLNLFIAVILDNFQSVDAEELPVTRAQVQRFIEVWSHFDAAGTYFMPTPLLPQLLLELDPPLGVRGLTYEDDRKTYAERLRHIIQATYIPDHQGQMHFMEVMHALAARVAGTHLPSSQEESLHRSLAARVPTMTSHVAREPLYTVAHYHAALQVQAAVRGFLARYARKMGMTGLWKMSFLAAVKSATMTSRWKRKGDDADPLDRWRRTSAMFINRMRFARASLQQVLRKNPALVGEEPGGLSCGETSLDASLMPVLASGEDSRASVESMDGPLASALRLVDPTSLTEEEAAAALERALEHARHEFARRHEADRVEAALIAASSRRNTLMMVSARDKASHLGSEIREATISELLPDEAVSSGHLWVPAPPPDGPPVGSRLSVRARGPLAEVARQQAAMDAPMSPLHAAAAAASASPFMIPPPPDLTEPASVIVLVPAPIAGEETGTGSAATSPDAPSVPPPDSTTGSAHSDNGEGSPVSPLPASLHEPPTAPAAAGSTPGVLAAAAAAAAPQYGLPAYLSRFGVQSPQVRARVMRAFGALGRFKQVAGEARQAPPKALTPGGPRLAAPGDAADADAARPGTAPPTSTNERGGGAMARTWGEEPAPPATRLAFVAESPAAVDEPPPLRVAALVPAPPDGPPPMAHAARRPYTALPGGARRIEL